MAGPGTGTRPEAVPPAGREITKTDGLVDRTDLPVLPGVGIDIVTLGKAISASGYFADAQDAAQAMVKVLAGQEMGIGPIRAMTDIHIIAVEDPETHRKRSSVALGATLMAMLIQRSGRYDYRLRALTEERCAIEYFELGRDGTSVSLGESEFTTADAAKAGLLRKSVWQKFRRNMLFSRAMSNGAKWYCSSVFGGAVYTPEELRDVAGMAEEPTEVAETAKDGGAKADAGTAATGEGTPPVPEAGDRAAKLERIRKAQEALDLSEAGLASAVRGQTRGQKSYLADCTDGELEKVAQGLERAAGVRTGENGEHGKEDAGRGPTEGEAAAEGPTA
jgi:hypothetical protein